MFCVFYLWTTKYYTGDARHMPINRSHIDGYRWPSTKQTPGHQQQQCWLKLVTYEIYHTTCTSQSYIRPPSIRGEASNFTAQSFGCSTLNILRPRQHICHVVDDIFKFISCTKVVTLDFVLKCPIDNRSVLVQIMAWCWTGDKPLSEPMFP